MNIIGGFNFIDKSVNFAQAPGLNGATYVKTIAVNGTTYVYVAGEDARGIQVLSMKRDGTLSPVMSVGDSQTVELSGAIGLDVVKVGSEFFLAAIAYSGNAISMFRIDDDGVGTDGHLIHLDTYRNSPIGGEPTEAQGLVSGPSSIDAVTVGNKTFFVASGYNSDAISVYQVSGNGTLTLTDSVLDSEKLGYQLDQAWALDTHVIGNKTFVIAGSYGADDGFSVFRLNGQGKLIDADDVTFAENRSVRDITAIEINGKNYVVVANTSGNDMLIYEMGANGKMTFLTVTDMFAKFELFDLQNVEPITVDGVDFLLATSSQQDTLAVFSIDADGELDLVQSITSPVDLNGADDIHVQQMGARTFVMVTGDIGDSIAVFEIGANDDALVGTSAADKIVGQNGDDDLIGLSGADLLIGGAGSDVLSGRRGEDELYGGADGDILIGGRGNDLLQGGTGADFLLGGIGFDRVSYADSGSGITIDLANGTVSGGSGAGDVFASIEAVAGSAHSDTLIGDSSRNTLLGGDGDDTLNGLGGKDRLDGQGGKDVVNGGGGDDRLILGAGNDVARGGSQNDRIDGGTGRDRMSGDGGNDDLNGGAGADTLTGGSGDDALNGGSGADVFVFTTNHGGDTIEDFETGTDRIDFENHSGFNDFSDVLAGSFEFMGNTVIGGGANSIQLLGVAKSELDQGDFLF